MSTTPEIIYKSLVHFMQIELKSFCVDRGVCENYFSEAWCLRNCTAVYDRHTQLRTFQIVNIRKRLKLKWIILSIYHLIKVSFFNVVMDIILGSKRISSSDLTSECPNPIPAVQFSTSEIQSFLTVSTWFRYSQKLTLFSSCVSSLW